MNDDERVLLAKTLAGGPLGEQMAKYPLMFAKAVMFGERPSIARPTVVSSGSCSLVTLDCGPIVVTCEHVIAGYEEMAATHNDVIFQVGEVVIDPLKQLIDRDQRLDLATVSLTDDQVRAITSCGPIGTQFFVPRSWPPEQVKAGQFVAFGGFPGSLRTVESFDQLAFASWSSGGSEVSSVSEGQFVSVFEREAWVRSFGDAHQLALTALGGLSGGPAFVSRGLYWDFVGVVSSHQENYDAMFFSLAARLRPDGRIERLPG